MCFRPLIIEFCDLSCFDFWLLIIEKKGTLSFELMLLIFHYLIQGKIQD